MTALHSRLRSLVDQVSTAVSEKRHLNIQGAGSKWFYGYKRIGDALPLREYHGIVSHEPSELVVTVRAGTPIRELESALAEHSQHLAFEPPRFGGHGGTVGGMVATALSGPARASSGAVRDHILGVTAMNGRGQILEFGGQVIKNVAGYDVSRLLAGSMGTLGVILEVSLKVLPVAPAMATLQFECDEAAALKKLAEWGGRPLPVHASVWYQNKLCVRLQGARAAVNAAITSMSGTLRAAEQGHALWDSLRDHTHEFFADAEASVASSNGVLWRLSVPQTARPIDLGSKQLIEWHGAQRWVVTSRSADEVRDAVKGVGGHAVMFRSWDQSAGVFSRLDSATARIHRELKDRFDPDRIFNRGRMYSDL